MQVHGSFNQLPSEEGITQRKTRIINIRVLAVVLAAMIIVAIVLCCLNSLFRVSLDWDEGKWSESLVVNCNEPSIIEFDNKIFMFYSVITENTIRSDDDVVMFPEHILTDVLYRVFDGKNFSEPVALTSPIDKISVKGKYFVFEDKLYAVLSEWWISNYTTHETKSQVRLEVFDGNNWHEAQGPYDENGSELHNLSYFVHAGKVWAVGQYMERPVAGHFSNVFAFKTYDGNVWSELRNFTNPVGAPDDWKLSVAENQLWFVWSNTTVYGEPTNEYRHHNDVWLGGFDGENWNSVTMLSALDDTGSNSGFFLSVFEDELFAFWSGEYFDTSEHGEWVWVLRRFNLTDGSMSALTPVTLESGYKCSPWSTRVYDGRLYVLWYSAYQNWKSMIVSFNGTEWSSVYHFDGAYDADGLFVYNGKLWAYGTEVSTRLNEAGWTYLRSYTKSG